MPTKRSDQLFGDDGANGPRAPIGRDPAPGFGIHNRAVAYGEDLTSFTANKMTYALALNDDDLDFRLSVFEEGGLDGVYRLGARNIAGGGRRIRLNGGAVEGWTELGDSYATDVANAVFRANTLSDTKDGSVAFDAASRGTSPGAAAYSLLDRRALVLETPATTFEDMQLAVLNQNNQAPDSITLLGRGRFTQFAGDATDVLLGIDLIEVIAGLHRGLYVVTRLLSTHRAQLIGLGGKVPIFGSDTEVLTRLFRPVVAIGGRSGGGPSHGLRVVGLPGDEDEPLGHARGALELVAGGRDGLRSPVSEQGLRYALRTQVRTADPNQLVFGGSITASGTFEAEALDLFNWRHQRAVDFGWPGFRFNAPAGSGLAPIGFLADNRRLTGPFHGQLVVSDDGFERDGVLKTGDRIEFVHSIVMGLGHSPMAHPGALVEVFYQGTHLGTYRVYRSAFASNTLEDMSTPLSLYLRYLDGQLPNLNQVAPIGGTVTVRVLSSVTVGRHTVESAGAVETYGTPHISSLDVSAPVQVPEDHIPVALSLASHGGTNGYFIRAVEGRSGSSTFSVSSEGVVKAAQIDVPYATYQGVTSFSYSYPEPKVYSGIAVPLSMWVGSHRTDVTGPIGEPGLAAMHEIGWTFTGTLGEWDPGIWGSVAWRFDYGPALLYPLAIPLVGFLPHGAMLNAVNICYHSVFPTTCMQLRIVEMEGFANLTPAVELGFPLPSRPKGNPVDTTPIRKDFYMSHRIDRDRATMLQIVNTVDVPWVGTGNFFAAIKVALEYSIDTLEAGP